MCEHVWAVSEGSYSDYHIRRVFASKEMAEAYLAEVGTDDNGRIEEWRVDTDLDRDRLWFDAWMRDDLTLDSIELREYDDDHQPSDEPRLVKSHFGDFWVISVRAREREHAIKIATEKVAMAKAQATGIT